MKNILQTFWVFLLLTATTLTYGQTPLKAFRFENNLADTAGNEITIGNLGVTYTASTPTRGQALRINQTGVTPTVRARLGSATGLNTGNASFSFSFWLFLDAAPNAGKIMEYGNSGTATGGYNGIQLERGGSNVANTTIKLTNGSTTILDNTEVNANHVSKWRFYTVVYNSATSQFLMYVDGVLKESQTVSGGININSTAWTAGDHNVASAFNMDDFEIYNVAITAAQALSKFKTAIAPFVPTAQTYCFTTTFNELNTEYYTAAPISYWSSVNATTPQIGIGNASTGNYFTSVVVAGIESDRVPINVTILQPTTPTPVGAATQNRGQGARLSNLGITGTSLKYYPTANDALLQRNEIASGTFLNMLPTTYYVTQQNNPCRSTPLAVTASFDRTVITNVTTTGITHSRCTISFSINPNSTNATQPVVNWGLSPTTLTNARTGSLLYTGSTVQNSNGLGLGLGNLQPSTTYYYTIGSTNSFYQDPGDGTVYSFTTLAGPAFPSAPATQTVCQPATIASLFATGTNLKWYDSEFSSTVLASNTALVNNQDYWVSQTIGAVESGRTSVGVLVNSGTTPAAPTAPATYTFCNVAPAQRLLTSVGATGTNLKWYDSASATTPITTASASGTYFVTQSTGVCESPRVAVSITVQIVTGAVAPTPGNQSGFRVVNIAYQVVNGVVTTIPAGQTLNDLMLTYPDGTPIGGSNLKYYITNSTTVVPNSTPITFNLTNGNPAQGEPRAYDSSIILSNCESTSIGTRIFLQTQYLPDPIAATVTVCGNANRAALETAYPANIYRIYTVASGGTPLENNDVVNIGQNFVARYHAASGLEGNRVAFNVVQNTVSTTWNGTIWSNGEPDNNKAAIFAGNYTNYAGGLAACSVTVNSGVTVSFIATSNNQPNNLNVNGSVTVLGTGSLLLDERFALTQADGYQNVGNVTTVVKTNLKRLDYTYWSSPVANQNLQNFSPNTLPNRFYTYNEPTGAFAPVNPATNVFETGKGYSIRAPNNFTTTAQSFDGVFRGVPNNGDITVNISNTALPGGNGFNLIGNPYPSTIEANTFFNLNGLGTIYFWTKVATGQGLGNYASLTWSGGVAATLGGLTPFRYIVKGQGFIFKSANSSLTTIKFTNAMRGVFFLDQFFRTTNNPTSNNPKVWLNLTGTNDVFSQTLVAYDANTTNGFDGGYDGEQINTSNTLSTIIADKTLSIQSRQAFANTDVVPMAINIETAGTYNISIDHTEGIFGNSQNVFLNDNLTGTTHNLSQSAYSFVATAGNVNNRFELRYQAAALGLNNNLLLENSIIAFKNNGVLKIQSTVKMESVEVFDIRGALLFSAKDVNSNTFDISNLLQNNAILIARIKADGQTVSKKVIF